MSKSSKRAWRSWKETARSYDMQGIAVSDKSVEVKYLSPFHATMCWYRSGWTSKRVCLMYESSNRSARSWEGEELMLVCMRKSKSSVLLQESLIGSPSAIV
jgi:hypothetical protein